MFKDFVEFPKSTFSRRGAAHFHLLLLGLFGIWLTPVFGQAPRVGQTTGRPVLAPASTPDPIARSGQQTSDLEFGQPVEREIAGGQKHFYKISLAAGQYALIDVKQNGIDLGINFQLPHGEVIREYLPYGEKPEVSFGWVSPEWGSYLVEIYPRASAPAGRYVIRIAELRMATEKDHALQEARDLFQEYVRLKRASRFAEARVPLLRSLELRERELGRNDPLVVQTVGLLASNYEDTGDYAKAEPVKTRFLDSIEKTLGPDSPQLAGELAQLGAASWKKGDYFKAEELYTRALAIFKRADLMDTPEVAALWNGMGEIYYERGDFPAAESYFERSRATWEKLFGPEHFHLAPSYSHLGHVAYDAGDYAKAELQFQKALALTEKGIGPDHTHVTGFLNDLAMVYCTTGNFEKGEALYRRAIANHEQKDAMGQPVVQESLFGLARCLAAHGNVADAVKYQARASELAERYVAGNLAFGSEREKLAVLDSLSSQLSRNISLHTDLLPNDPTARDLAITGILQRKGRIQDAMSDGLAALNQRSGPEDRKLIDQLNEANSTLAKLVLSGPSGDAPQDCREQVRKLEADVERLEAEVSRRSAGFYQSSHSVTLSAVQAAIPADAALIEFAAYRPFDPRAADNETAYGKPRYVAYVMRRSGEVGWKELGEAEVIDQAIDALRQALRDPGRKDVQRLARVLDQELMRPLRALTGDATHLLISPDGELNLLPFAALVDEQDHYLIQRYTFTYLTSGRELLRMQVSRESRSDPLLIANPSFGEPAPVQLADAKAEGKYTARNAKGKSVTTARDLSAVYFAPLAGTEVEAQSIQKLFPNANLLTGAQATESALKRAAAPSILHIATHGFFLYEKAEPGGKTTARSPILDATRGISARARTGNPLLRSGLALADANLRSTGGDDGILTALEASGLNLWGTKLVVLSACDTGVGEVRNGEGVYGLRRAFVLAGAESLVMSLWPISDYTTRELMTQYYENLKHGLGRGAALRQVQLDLLTRNPHLHPFYWANFIQSGEWANLDGRR